MPTFGRPTMPVFRLMLMTEVLYPRCTPGEKGHDLGLAGAVLCRRLALPPNDEKLQLAASVKLAPLHPASSAAILATLRDRR